MAELYFFNDDAPSLQVTLDTGEICPGVRTTHKGRNCFCVTLPDTATGGITVGTLGYVWNTSQRGLLVLPNDGNPEYTFALDDIRGSLEVVPPEPGPTPPGYHGTPEEIINQVYAQGYYNLATHDGCGQFTEAACSALHQHHSPWWGHISKNPGQNQYNGHAVDAVYLLKTMGESQAGVYDIIHDSVSVNATPCCNWKDAGNPELWYYPA